MFLLSVCLLLKYEKGSNRHYGSVLVGTDRFSNSLLLIPMFHDMGHASSHDVAIAQNHTALSQRPQGTHVLQL